MVGFNLSEGSFYGNATINGSTHDLTCYKDTKYASKYYQSLLDPEATIIRRKSGAKVPKRQHVVIYRTEHRYVRPAELTDSMVTCIPRKDAAKITDGFIPILHNVIDTKRTFHAQTDPVYEVFVPTYDKAPITMTKKTRVATTANIAGIKRHNRLRDW